MPYGCEKLCRSSNRNTILDPRARYLITIYLLIPVAMPQYPFPYPYQPPPLPPPAFAPPLPFAYPPPMPFPTIGPPLPMPPMGVMLPKFKPPAKTLIAQIKFMQKKLTTATLNADSNDWLDNNEVNNVEKNNNKNIFNSNNNNNCPSNYNHCPNNYNNCPNNNVNNCQYNNHITCCEKTHHKPNKQPRKKHQWDHCCQLPSKSDSTSCELSNEVIETHTDCEET